MILHSENGVLGMGPAPGPGEEDYDLINAGKQPVTLLPGGSFFHHADSFAMMRGGHLDICVLGAFQVSATGDLANWHTGAADAIPAVGGAMDLAIGAKKTYVMMEHLTKAGESKIVPALQLSADRHRLRQPHLHRPGGDRRHAQRPEADRQGRRPVPRRTATRDRRAADRASRQGHTMNHAFICDAVRTPFGRYGGALSSVRTDDLGAIPIKALMARNPQGRLGGRRRRASTAAPTRPARTTATSRAWRRCWPACRSSVPGATINRLCGSGLDAVGTRGARHQVAARPS